jgi:hypothetical protein
MSLLSYASPWTNDNSQKSFDSGSSAPSRKRVPTMTNPRKTIRVRPNSDSSADEYEVYQSDDTSSRGGRGTNAKPDTIEDVISSQTETNTKINSILNKITSFSSDDKLGDFNPMPYPTTINRKNADSIIQPDEILKPGKNPLLPNTGIPEIARGGTPSNGLYFRPSESIVGGGKRDGSYANYREAYGKEGLSGKEPYYSKMGIGESGDKMMDRLNYMTQMLESLQMEKTNHVTEEFILYTLLGVFMIYIVDGFSRGGKYVR